MGYINKLIPNKYYGKTHNFSKLTRLLLHNNFKRDCTKFIKDFLQYRIELLDRDLKILDNELFTKNNYDYIYSQYDINPINYDKMKGILLNTSIYRDHHMFIIMRFLVVNKICLDRFSVEEILHLDDLLSKFKAVEDKYILICTLKNMADFLFDYDSTKILIESNLDKYYSSISYWYTTFLTFKFILTTH